LEEFQYETTTHKIVNLDRVGGVYALFISQANGSKGSTEICGCCMAAIQAQAEVDT